VETQRHLKITATLKLGQTSLMTKINLFILEGFVVIVSFSNAIKSIIHLSSITFFSHAEENVE
jgi:hypothetical protein